MRYPGNATLTRDIQERILSTFEQTLAAAAEGNRREGLLGCDFILRLDPMFEPARDLQQRLGEGEGPVEIADLRAAYDEIRGSAGPPAAEAVPEPSTPATPAPEVDVPEVPPPAAPAEPPAPPAAAEIPAFDELEDLDINLQLGGPEAPEPPAEPPAPSVPAGAEPPTPVVDDLEDLDVVASLEDAAAVTDAAAAEQPQAPAMPEPEPPVAAPPPLEIPTAAPPPPEAPAAAPPPPEAPAAAPEVPAQPEAAAVPRPEPEPAIEPTTPEPPAVAAEAEQLPPVEAAAVEPLAQEPPPVAATPEEPAVEPPAPSLDAEGGISLDAEPAARLDTESEQRISDLLDEGQAAFDKGEFQGAIDAWSRIFLIDIDHPEANRRIEQARKLKAEADREVEEKFHEGLAHLEAGDLEAAAGSFRGVLELQPTHVTARDYLEKLDAGEVPVPLEMPAEEAAPEIDPEAALAEASAIAEEAAGEEVPKPERGKKAVGERMVTVKRSPLRSPVFLGTAVVGLVLVLAGGWYLWTHKSQLFPNSTPPPAASAPAPDPVERARELHADGRTPMAVALLRRLPPDHPGYGEAQTLIAQWEVQGPSEQPTGPTPEEQQRREALVAGARRAESGGEYLLTSELLAEAAAIAPLKGEEAQLLAQADEQLQSLQSLISLFRQGDWDFAIRDLWLVRESEPGNRDVVRLLVDSYYNLGVRDLQRSDPVAAAGQFREAIGLTPDDPDLQRLLAFAEAYQGRPQDLQYRIFVKYLPFR